MRDEQIPHSGLAYTTIQQSGRLCASVWKFDMFVQLKSSQSEQFDLLERPDLQLFHSRLKLIFFFFSIFDF